MRHRNSGRKLGRNSSHRNAMFRNMVTSLINEERIETTVPKAKELRPIIEKLLTSAKHNAPSIVAAAAEDQKASKTAARVAAIRQAGKFVRGKDALQKLFSDLAEQYHTRNGGYTRIVRTRNRLGDNAEMAIIELIPEAVSAE
jgi:large subunit ribosomal protein L17